MKAKGRLVWRDLGAGSWALEGQDGVTYTLEGQVDAGLVGRAVEVEATPAPEAMGFAMTGPTLRVRSLKAAS